MISIFHNPIYQILEKNEQVWLSFDPQKSNSDTANIQLGIPVLEETQSFRPLLQLFLKI
ncbi:MAG: hypothetical protein CM1200mP37_5580 [Chloroflexota bacterium]|nr:MAG: hypothetical protein CM1200mP37_5580 [Chloroflexota bacterium]